MNNPPVNTTHRTERPFYARPENYQKNRDMGANLRVIPASVGHDTGSTPGIAVFNKNTLFLVLTAEHAYDLANHIADTLETHPNRATTNKEN